MYVYGWLFVVKVACWSPSYDRLACSVSPCQIRILVSAAYACVYLSATHYTHTFDAHQLYGAQITSIVAVTLPLPSCQSWESYDAVFCNYFSFGVDAVAALAFHEHRNKNPHLFTSRCR